ncbi:DNA cytosine methyltransferase [Sphingomonas panni]
MDLRTEFEPETDDFRGISLCAGYGGLDLGLHIAEPQYRTVGYVGRESHAAATLVARMADEALGKALVWDDLRSFDGRPWRGRVHLLSAGYPCQPFSYAGRRGGDSDPRHLWPEVARIAGEIEPEWIFCENVEGHLSMGYADVEACLRGMGYTTKAGIFTAREAGASHRRRRLFILAHADRLGWRLRARSGAEGREPIDDGAIRLRHGFGRAVLDGRGDQELDVALAGDASDRVDAGCYDRPIFAPGPGEFQEWDRLLAQHPDLQPALLRDGDGMADRVERTRGAGNGVCSLAASLAWAVLKTAHQLDAR